MSFCPKCGAEVKDGAQFCHVCGFSMAAPAVEPAQNTQQSSNPFNTPIPPVESMDLSSIFTRAMNIMFKPKTEWQAVEAETPNTSSILIGYVIPLALIPAIFTIIGYGLIGYKVGFGPWAVTVKSWTMGLSAGLTSFIASVAGVYIVSLIVDALAPSFKSQKNFGRAMQLVAYSFTPMWVIGVLNIFPPLAVLSIFGLYGLYLMYVGFDHTMKPAKENLVGYYLATIGITIVTYIVLGLILGLILGAIFITSTAAYNVGI